ncbi:MAG: hypothetical protein OWQ48_04235 [Desulfurococcus sp.]|nr:hypothetical protein [Desulfurococcus sp.]
MRRVAALAVAGVVLASMLIVLIIVQHIAPALATQPGWIHERVDLVNGVTLRAPPLDNWYKCGVEESSSRECSAYISIDAGSKLGGGEVRDIRLIGEAEGEGSIPFNFYIMSEADYQNWINGKPYTAIYERRNVMSVSFNIPLTVEQASSRIYFIVERAQGSMPSVTPFSAAVKINAVLEWERKTII